MKAAAGLIADQIYAWQLTNRVRVAAMAKEKCDAAGIHPRKIATGFLLPFFEAAGNVDATDLTELWAKLLVSAVSDDAAQHPLYIRTLEGMNGADAALLYELADPIASHRKGRGYCRIVVEGKPGPTDAAIARLLSLSLLSRGERIGDKIDGEHATFDVLALTPFAWQLIGVIMPERAIGVGQHPHPYVHPF